MGFLSKLKGQTTGVTGQPAQPAQASVHMQAVTVSLEKGSSITLEKREPGAAIQAVNGWSARGKDYDLKALVRLHNGQTIYVGAANADEALTVLGGAVSHSGDSTEAGVLETITLKWHADIASVALSSYSALENGTGSFRQYGVYVNIHNGNQVIGIAAKDASATYNSYTLCFGEIIYNADQTFTVKNLEMYSAPSSEKRIGYRGDQVFMDIGPEGQTK